MNFATKLRQTLTYWAPGPRDISGAPTFAAPVQLKCRWEDKAELVRNSRGEEIVSKSRAFLTSSVVPEGYMYLGSSAEEDPREVTGALEIAYVSATPDIAALQELKVAWG